MTRLRYSRDQALAEATRRADEFVAVRPDSDQYRLRGAHPDSLATPNPASKHPVAWVVVYAPVPPDGGVIDGGELFVTVDLESGSVGVRAF